MNKSIRTRKGFTLIELLVVVLILGILVAVALPSYLSSVKTSRANTANSNAKTIATAFQAYGVKNGTYGATPALSTITADLGGNIPANPCNGDTNNGVAGSWTLTGSGSGPLTVTAVNSATTSYCNASDIQVYSVSL